MGLVCLSLLVADLFMVEVADEEKRNPYPFVMTNTMNEEKGRHKVTGDCTWYGVHHPSQMYHRIKPKHMHLLFSEVSSCHVEHGF
jgi:hypothetical protein